MAGKEIFIPFPTSFSIKLILIQRCIKDELLKLSFSNARKNLIDNVCFVPETMHEFY